MATPACTDRLPAHAGAIDSRTAPCPTASLPTQACLAHAPYQPTLSCADDQRSLVELLDRLGVLSRLGRAIDDGAEILRRQADASGALIALAAPSGTYTVARAGEPFPARAHELAGKALLRGVARDGDLRAALLRGGQPCQWFLITKHNRGPERTPSAAPRLDFLDCALALYAAAFADGAGAPPQDDLPLSPRHRRIQALFPHIVTRTPEMLEILGLLELFAPTDYPILIQGESGTGKELIAKVIHNNTAADEPYIPINCSAIVETLLESELFGHEKGSFTGAVNRKPGKFELARYGTVFLDEISEMSLNLQAKLLRVLQEKEFERVGGKDRIKVNARIIAATNKDLRAMIREGLFRDDLYYRLNIVTINIPPLRERREDLKPLIDYLLAKINLDLHKRIVGVSDEMFKIFEQYGWPGNIRELENLLVRASVVAKGQVLVKSDFPDLNVGAPSAKVVEHEGEYSRDATGRFLTLDEVEELHIRRVITETKKNKGEICDILGISRPTFERKLEKYNIPFERE